jgi:hypothetical protein
LIRRVQFPVTPPPSMELSVFHHSWQASVLVETQTGRHCTKAEHSCETPTAVRLVKRRKRGYEGGMGLAHRTAGVFNLKMRLWRIAESNVRGIRYGGMRRIRILREFKLVTTGDSLSDSTAVQACVCGCSEEDVVEAETIRCPTDAHRGSKSSNPPSRAGVKSSRLNESNQHCE